jgi:hypothetical protein
VCWRRKWEDGANFGFPALGSVVTLGGGLWCGLVVNLAMQAHIIIFRLLRNQPIHLQHGLSGGWWAVSEGMSCQRRKAEGMRCVELVTPSSRNPSHIRVVLLQNSSNYTHVMFFSRSVPPSMG